MYIIFVTFKNQSSPDNANTLNTNNSIVICFQVNLSFKLKNDFYELNAEFFILLELFLNIRKHLI